MPSPSLDNVIAFNEARAARPSPPNGKPDAIFNRAVKPESIGVINDCRDMVLSRICAALSSTFDKIEDELFELAGKSPDRETQNMYLDARTQAREKRPEIEAVFRTQFVSFFEKKVVGNNTPAQEETGFNLDELSLVEDDALTENLAVNDIAKRLTNKCDEELRALSQRMGFLLAEPELGDEANPIAPDTVVRALKAACDQLTAGFQTRLTVLRMLEQHMSQEMLSVYRDVNTHLVSRQVMPTLKPSFRRAQTQIVRKPNVGSADSNAAAPSAIDTGEQAQPAAQFDALTAAGKMAGAGQFGAYSASRLGLPPAEDAVVLFQTLQRLMTGDSSTVDQTGGARGPQTAPEYSSFTTGGFAPVPPRSSAASNASTFAPTAFPPMVASDLVQKLSEIQHDPPGPQANAQGAGNGLNVLHGIRAQNVSEQANQVDAMTIDIVAMLFDFVFDDKSIPDSIKALIARLQIPVLKVAILDKTFFSKKTHPVRRLLDALASASVAFAGEAERDDPLYKMIERIVERVQGEFDTDIALFEILIGEFEAFLRAREAANAEVIEQSARAMHEREKREMARLIAQAEVSRHTSKDNLPAPVLAMLKGPWARVLERVYLRDGGRSARFNDVNETADQLVWSVQPKLDASQRKDLVSALPLLLRRLQEGLDIAAVEKDERDLFFMMLVDCHAAAVKAGLRGESVISLFAAARGDMAVAPLFEKLIAEERAREQAANENRSGMARIQFTDRGVEIEEVKAPPTRSISASSELTPGTGQTSSDEHDFFSESQAPSTAAPDPAIPPAELKRGTWVEFIQSSGARVRAKLSWVSPLKGVYLFTNPGAGEALSIAPDALRSQLMRGVARIIEESSLVDRAVDRMVSSLGRAAS
jgi:hypothetical protein